jgi:hypothetical protein
VLGPLRRRRSRLQADRLTLALAVSALGTLGVVGAGEFQRRYRRRLAEREAQVEHPIEGPVEALQVAGQASQDTLIVAIEGYSAASRRETVLFNLLSGFIGAFAFARVSTAGIRQGWWPLGNVRIGGRHIHHFVPGIVVAFGSGTAALVSESRRAELVLAVPFGAGVGLTLDEAALLLGLRDVYWTREGILSVQLSLGVASVLAAAIIGLRMLQGGEKLGEEQGLIPGAEGEIAASADLAGGAAFAG